MEIILLFILLVPIFLGIRYYLKTQTPDYKGKVGEAVVAGYLQKLPENEYIVYNDIYLKTGNSSIQIDHLILSIYGIFVIETKNYTGWIFGSENQRYWTQIIYNNKTKFRNPIKQNNTHINSLKWLLSEFDFLEYFSLIVFTGTAELKSINSLTPVIYEDKLFHYILRSKEEQIIDISQLKNISKVIDKHIMCGDDKKGIHLQNVNRSKFKMHWETVSNRSDTTDTQKFPRCGNVLKIREGSYGEFYGCSKYPDCKYTKNIR